MDRSEQAVFTNMCMIYDNEGKVLVQNRISKTWPGVTFPGGHVEKGESFVESVIREVYEETGLEILHPTLCGIKQFQDKNDARYVVLLYKANQFKGRLQSSDEGEVFWINRANLLDYQLSSDFERMLPIFEKDNHSEFFYYRDENTDWNLKLL